MARANLKAAIKTVEKRGMLLVFPIANRAEIPSLWSEFYPRTKMRWEWDQNGDSRVSDLWFLREQLSRSGQLVYGKFFRGRATLMSLELFTNLLKVLNSQLPQTEALSFTAAEILELLEEDSPVSTKRLKKLTDLVGRENESRYQRALKELWSQLLICAYGEVDEGAFPSIAIGASRVLFEEQWNAAIKLKSSQAWSRVRELLQAESPFLKYIEKSLIPPQRVGSRKAAENKNR